MVSRWRHLLTENGASTLAGGSITPCLLRKGTTMFIFRPAGTRPGGSVFLPLPFPAGIDTNPKRKRGQKWHIVRPRLRFGLVWRLTYRVGLGRGPPNLAPLPCTLLLPHPLPRDPAGRITRGCPASLGGSSRRSVMATMELWQIFAEHRVSGRDRFSGISPCVIPSQLASRPFPKFPP